MKKWIFLCGLSFSVIGYAQEEYLQTLEQNSNQSKSNNQDAKHQHCFCNKRCFSYCKEKGQAVSSCSIINKTTISLSIICKCRALDANEILPLFYKQPKSCLIKPAQAEY